MVGRRGLLGLARGGSCMPETRARGLVGVYVLGTTLHNWPQDQSARHCRPENGPRYFPGVV